MSTLKGSRSVLRPHQDFNQHKSSSAGTTATTAGTIGVPHKQAPRLAKSPISSTFDTTGDIGDIDDDDDFDFSSILQCELMFYVLLLAVREHSMFDSASKRFCLTLDEPIM